MRMGAPTCFSDKLFAVSVLCICILDYTVTLLMILKYLKIVTPDEIQFGQLLTCLHHERTQTVVNGEM